MRVVDVVRLAVSVTLTVSDKDIVSDSCAEKVAESVALSDLLGEADADGDSDIDGESDTVGDALTVGETDIESDEDMESVEVPLRVLVREVLVLNDVVSDAEIDHVMLFDDVRDIDRVEEAVSLKDNDRVIVSDSLVVTEWVKVLLDEADVLDD